MCTHTAPYDKVRTKENGFYHLAKSLQENSLCQGEVHTYTHVLATLMAEDVKK